MRLRSFVAWVEAQSEDGVTALESRGADESLCRHVVGFGGAQRDEALVGAHLHQGVHEARTQPGTAVVRSDDDAELGVTGDSLVEAQFAEADDLGLELMEVQLTAADALSGLFGHELGRPARRFGDEDHHCPVVGLAGHPE